MNERQLHSLAGNGQTRFYVLIGYVLDLDSLAAFRVVESCEDLIRRVSSDRYALTDPQLLAGVKTALGRLPDGMQYAPTYSLLVGGRRATENFHLETANIHLRNSLATWEALRRD